MVASSASALSRSASVEEEPPDWLVDAEATLRRQPEEQALTEADVAARVQAAVARVQAEAEARVQEAQAEARRLKNAVDVARTHDVAQSQPLLAVRNPPPPPMQEARRPAQLDETLKAQIEDLASHQLNLFDSPAIDAATEPVACPQHHISSLSMSHMKGRGEAPAEGTAASRLCDSPRALLSAADLAQFDPLAPPPRAPPAYVAPPPSPAGWITASPFGQAAASPEQTATQHEAPAGRGVGTGAGTETTKPSRPVITSHPAAPTSGPEAWSVQSSLAAMFPDLGDEIVGAVLEAVGGSAELAVDRLVAMTSSEPARAPPPSLHVAKKRAASPPELQQLGLTPPSSPWAPWESPPSSELTFRKKWYGRGPRLEHNRF